MDQSWQHLSSCPNSQSPNWYMDPNGGGYYYIPNNCYQYLPYIKRAGIPFHRIDPTYFYVTRSRYRRFTATNSTTGQKYYYYRFIKSRILKCRRKPSAGSYTTYKIPIKANAVITPEINRDTQAGNATLEEKKETNENQVKPLKEKDNTTYRKNEFQISSSENNDPSKNPEFCFSHPIT